MSKSTYTPEKANKIIGLVRGGEFRVDACNMCMVKESTFRAWMESDSELALRAREAETFRNRAIIGRMWDAGAAKNGIMAANCRWILEKLAPKQYGSHQMHSVEPGATITLTNFNGVALPQPTDKAKDTDKPHLTSNDVKQTGKRNKARPTLMDVAKDSKDTDTKVIRLPVKGTGGTP